MEMYEIAAPVHVLTRKECQFHDSGLEASGVADLAQLQVVHCIALDVEAVVRMSHPYSFVPHQPVAAMLTRWL